MNAKLEEVSAKVPRRQMRAKLSELAAKKGFSVSRAYAKHLKEWVYKIQSPASAYSLEYCRTDYLTAYQRCFIHLNSKKDLI